MGSGLVVEQLLHAPVVGGLVIVRQCGAKPTSTDLMRRHRRCTSRDHPMQPTPTSPESWSTWVLYGSLRRGSPQHITALASLAVIMLLGGTVGIGAVLLASVWVAAMRVGVRLAFGSLEGVGTVPDADGKEEPI